MTKNENSPRSFRHFDDLSQRQWLMGVHFQAWGARQCFAMWQDDTCGICAEMGTAILELAVALTGNPPAYQLSDGHWYRVRPNA